MRFVCFRKVKILKLQVCPLRTVFIMAAFDGAVGIICSGHTIINPFRMFLR